MSLRIDVKKIYAVLLADGWHRVSEHSFGYHTILNDMVAPVAGFQFIETSSLHDIKVSGPITSILAVQELA